MSEHVPTEVYAKEFYYQKALRQQLMHINELVEKFPEDNTDVKETLQSLTSSNPIRILDPDKLKRLKKEKLEIYEQIAPVYMEFLKEKAGL